MSARSRRLLRAALLIAASLLMQGFAAAPAEACMCAGTYSGTPPCQARWQYTEIFRAKVVRVTPAPPDARGFVVDGAARIQFEVLENFVGADSRTYTLDDPGSTCSFPFEAGKEYLVYARRGDVNVCSPTRLSSEAKEDLAYLRSLPKSPPRDGRIIGLVLHHESTQPERDRTPYAGAQIVVEGQGVRRTATTGRDGKYEIRVPAGKYRVRAETTPDMYAESLYSGEVELLDVRGCAVADFSVSFDGHLTGRLVTSDGTPVPHVRMDLLGEDGYLVAAGRTDLAGRIRIEHVPPGKLVLGFHTNWLSDPIPGLPPTFLPGTTNRADARVLTIKPSESITVDDFIVPDTMRFRTLSGVVQDPAGKPIDDVYVTLMTDSNDPKTVESTLATDRKGRFAFAVVEGQRYQVFVRQRTSLGDMTAELTGILATPDMKPIVLVPVRK